MGEYGTWGEHLRDIMIPPKTDAELPCYRLIRRQGNVKIFDMFWFIQCGESYSYGHSSVGAANDLDFSTEL